METYTGKINEFIEWVGGKDILTENNATNGLDVSGGPIRELIQNHLRNPFYTYEDKESGLYRMFSSKEAFNIWNSNREDNASLELFNFVRPSDYEISTDLTADPRYIMSGSGDNVDSRIIYHWEVKNNKGSYADSISATYTITTQDNRVSQFSEIYNSTQNDVNVSIYKYLDYGQNTVNIKLRASSTGASYSISFIVMMVKLDLTSTFDFNEKHILGETLKIPVKLTRNDASKSCSIFFYIDGNQVKKVDVPTNSSLEYQSTINDILNTYSPSTTLNKHVVHDLQIYAQTEYNGVTFRSNVLYYTFETASSDAITNYFINVSGSFNDGIPPLTDFTISGTQYEPVTLQWGYYTDQLQNNTQISVNWKLYTNETYINVATMSANNGKLSLNLTFVPDIYTDSEAYLIGYYNNIELIRIPISIQQSGLSIYETPLYNIKMSAYGKTNSSSDRAVWEYDEVTTEFTGLEWNDNSGWNDNSLRVHGLDQYATINYNPFYGNPSAGRTIEFEFEPEKVSDSSDIILTLGDKDGARIEVTSNKATLYSKDGVDRIHTNFKSNERIKLAFIINEESDDPDSNLLYIVNNGILERAAQGNYDFRANDGNILIGKSNSGVKFYSLRVYPRAISYTDEYNNYVFDSSDKSRIISDNNVINTESRTIDYNLCSNKIDTILISGNLNRILDSSMDKDGSLTNVTIERFCPFDTTKNFKCENCQIRKHGQSTLNYPISSMKFWLNKNTLGEIPTFTCEAQANLGLSKNRYKMRDDSIPANKFILQANYADSSGVHNGGLQRLIQNTWYDAVIDGEYKLRTEPQLFTTNQKVTHNSTDLREDGKVDGMNEDGKQWGDYFNRAFPYKIRIAPDSVPCVVFYKNIEGDNKNTFLGQYVLMEDKKSDFNYGERSIYKAASNDPFCLTIDHKSDDVAENKIWDNDNVLRVEVLNMNNNFTSYMSTTDTQGIGFEDVVYDENGNPSHYRWEDDFELIYPDPDDLSGNEAKGTDKFGSNSKFLKKAKPFVDWFNWLVSTYNNEEAFIESAAKHLDLYKMAAYYIFMLRCSLTDSGERNVQIKTYDGIHFHYEPWDMDIAFGNKNTGGIAFDPPVDRNTKIPGSTTYAISGRTDTTSNWLWDALENWPHWINVIVPKVAQALYAAGLTYENMTKMFDDEYANKWCEIIYNESGYFKYIQAVVGEPKLEWLQGARVGHRHWWMSTSMDYYDAKWSVGDFRTHNIYIAANHVQNEGHNDIITIAPTSPTYVALIQNDTPVSLAGVQNPQYTDGYNPAQFDISGLSLQYKVPFYIRGASYIEKIDLSCIANELDIVRFGSAYSEVLGAPLKEVNLGCPYTEESEDVYEGRLNAFDLNLSILSDDGNNSFENLETLNLRGQKERLFGMYNIRQFDLSNLKNVYAMGGQYSSFYSSKSGNNFDVLELPASTQTPSGEVVSKFTTLDLNNSSFKSIDFYDSVVHVNNIVRAVKTPMAKYLDAVRFTGTTCQNANTLEFVQAWVNQIVSTEGESALSDKTLVLENINWTLGNVTFDFLRKLAMFNGGNNKPQDGTLSGYIVLSNESALTSEQLTQIRNWFGESVFNKNSSGLVIDQQLDYIRINIGADAELVDGNVYLREGRRASLNATKFSLSEDDTQYNWFLREPGTLNNSSSYKSVSIVRGSDDLWYIKADESDYGEYDVQVLCTGGAEATTTTITIVGTTYPESFEINTENTVDSTDDNETFEGYFKKNGVGVEMYITSDEQFTATIADVTFSLVRNNDGRVLLNNASYTTFNTGDIDLVSLDQYLKYRSNSSHEYGLVLMSTAVPNDDTIYEYTLSADITFKSGVYRQCSYTFNLLKDDVVILANDDSELYKAVLAGYREETGSAPKSGLFYRTDLMKILTLSFWGYESVTSLKTLTNRSILDYVLNVEAVLLSGCLNIERINLYITSNSGDQFVFDKLSKLVTLYLNGCSKLHGTIDLTNNPNICMVLTGGTDLTVILPEGATIRDYSAGAPSSINFVNPKELRLDMIAVETPSALKKIDIVNVPNNKSYTALSKVLTNIDEYNMTHVLVSLNNIEEVVDMDTVEKMYIISKLKLDNSSDFEGRLFAEGAYIDALKDLNDNYNNLYITALLHYIRFENDTVEEICKQWGDSNGLAVELCPNYATIANTSDTSFASAGITDISWMKYFTQATQLSNNLFSDCEGITELVLPPNITTILTGVAAGASYWNNSGTFSRCHGLTKVILPEGVTTIGTSAFYECSNLEVIDIPSTVTYISVYAFSCEPTTTHKVKYIICRAINPPNLNSQAAFSIDKNKSETWVPIYVPDESLSEYKSKSNWPYFTDMLKPLSEFEQDAIDNGW